MTYEILVIGSWTKVQNCNKSENITCMQRNIQEVTIQDHTAWFFSTKVLNLNLQDIKRFPWL